jgi:hypothetical protein
VLQRQVELEQYSSTDFRATLKALRTSINVSDIDKSSVGKVIDFSPRRATWIRFQVSGGSGLNVGLPRLKRSHRRSRDKLRNEPRRRGSAGLSLRNLAF